MLRRIATTLVVLLVGSIVVYGLIVENKLWNVFSFLAIALFCLMGFYRSSKFMKYIISILVLYCMTTALDKFTGISWPSTIAGSIVAVMGVIIIIKLSRNRWRLWEL